MAATICSSDWFGVFTEQTFILTYCSSFSLTTRFTLKAQISYFPVSLGLT